MAYNASTVWEIRTTGSQDNGGGFADLVPGTSIDYSQQDSPQLVRTDIATDAAGTGISSATGGFTAAMQGNIIHLTGGGSTAGWYQITGYTSPNAVTIDRTAGSNKSGVTGNVGGTLTFGNLADKFTAWFVSGNIVYIKSGSYDVSGISHDITFAGTPSIQGYKIARGDTPTGSDRPSISLGANRKLRFTNAVAGGFVENIIFSGSYNPVVDIETNGLVFRNVKFYNSGAGDGRAVYQYSDGTTYVLCEFISTSGSALYALSTIYILYNCYLHNSKYGIEDVSGGIGSTILNSVIANCTAGIHTSSFHIPRLIGSVLYNCTTGYHGLYAAPREGAIINSIISECVTGANFPNPPTGTPVDHNCWYNTTDVNNLTKGPHDISTNPLMVDPGNGDFRLAIGSPCFNAGLQLSSIVGVH